MGDWSNMHQDLFDLILSNLFDIDQHTCSLVCRSWKQAVLASPHRCNSPCLMYNQKSNHLWRFFHPNTLFSKPFPILQNSVIRFSNHGWLLMMSRKNNTIFFFHPFNNRTIQLPTVPRYKSYTTICFFHPPTSPECFIVGIRSTANNNPREIMDIGVLRQGEGTWKVHKYVTTKDFDVSLAPPVLNRGLVYFVDVKGNVATFDINQHGQRCAWHVNNRCLRQRRHEKIKEHFLIKPKGEDSIYAVFGMMREERDVKAFRLVESNNMHWEAVDNLGEKVFYVSNTSSYGYITSDKRMANKIFFPKLHGDKFVFYCLDTEKYHSFDGNYSSQDSQGLQRLDFATWAMPTQQLNYADYLSWCLQVDETTT